MSNKINCCTLPPPRQSPIKSVSGQRMELIIGLGGTPDGKGRKITAGRSDDESGFLPGGCFPPYELPSQFPIPGPLPGPFPLPPISDLTPADRSLASRLHAILSDPETLLMAMFDPDVGETTLRRTPTGVVGPEGQPLFKVQTDLGMTAWIDPNTNQFYLQEPGYGGQLNVIGPMDLPPGAQFDPQEYYTANEVNELDRVARSGGWDSLQWKDRQIATQLHSTLSGPRSWAILSDPYTPSQLLRRQDGEIRGPEGQPLISVRLDDGHQAYVDPNTNQYYLGDGRQYAGGASVKGPFRLPTGSQFTNSYFDDREVDELTGLANRHSHLPNPRPSFLR